MIIVLIVVETPTTSCVSVGSESTAFRLVRSNGVGNSTRLVGMRVVVIFRRCGDVVTLGTYNGKLSATFGRKIARASFLTAATRTHRKFFLLLSTSTWRNPIRHWLFHGEFTLVIFLYQWAHRINHTTGIYSLNLVSKEMIRRFIWGCDEEGRWSKLRSSCQARRIVRGKVIGLSDETIYFNFLSNIN